MKDVRNDELIRLSMKPALPPDDEARIEAFLATHPEARATWEEERALGRALQALPDVPVSSNFTARVLQAVDLEGTRAGREQTKRGWLRAFWPRLSWAGLATLLAFFFVHEVRVRKQAQVAGDVILISKDSSKLPSAEVLRDFDAINQMRAASDDELLVVLK
jgi:hypothetical protein